MTKDDDRLEGIKSILAALGRESRTTFYRYIEQGLPARQDVFGGWYASKSEVLEWHKPEVDTMEHSRTF